MILISESISCEDDCQSNTESEFTRPMLENCPEYQEYQLGQILEIEDDSSTFFV